MLAKKPIPMPNNIADMIRIRSIRLEYYQDYLMGGLDIGFLKPNSGKLMLGNGQSIWFKKATFPNKEF
jgi:hypothetical protein